MSHVRAFAALLVPMTLLTGCTSGSKARGPEPTPVDLPATQVKAIETDLVSGRPLRVRRAIEIAPGTRLEKSFVRQLHGLKVSFDTDTAVAAGADQVSVRATVTAADGTQQQWDVTLDLIEGRYVIADTHVIEE